MKSPARRPLHSLALLALITIFASLTVAVPASADDGIVRAIKDGSPIIDLRYRFEWVDQQDFTRNANASTARLRLGYKTGAWHGLFALATFQVTETVGADGYNSTANGLTEYPVVPDPEDAWLGQGYLGYRTGGNTEIRLGRQAIALDNHRFVGNVDWRQFQQTMDAISVTSKPADRLTLHYSHIDRVNKIFGEHNPDPARAHADGDFDLFNVGWDTKVGKLTGYAYFLDYADAPDTSHKNLGLRFAGKRKTGDKLTLHYTAEYADQSDYEQAPSSVDATYLLGELGLQWSWATLRAAYEELGGDGTYAFQTPLATLHKFNGRADLFLTTPDEGLTDMAFSLDGKIGGAAWKVIWHEFGADSGSQDFGSELDLQVEKKFRNHYTVGLVYAAFSADAGGGKVDVDKFWGYLQFKL